MNAIVDISIVIPVFNSEKAIPELISRINQVVDQISNSYEILLVDDFSLDNSWEILKELQDKNDNISIFRLSKNYGQHNATICGIKHAVGNVIITMDDDLEHLPESIPTIYQNFIDKQYDILYACPNKRQKRFLRNFLGNFWNYLLKLSKKGLSDASSFRIMNKNLAKNIALHQEPFVYIEAIVLWYTNNIGQITIPFGKRKYGTSNYTVSQLYNLNHDLGMHYNTHVLKFLRNFGVTVFLVSFILIIYFLLKKIYGSPVPGYTSLIIVALFSTGSILWGLGYLGTYIGKMFRVLNKEPQFFVKEQKKRETKK
ncbi:MAG: glycosyltransferase family 2 protein [Vicingaceae bacterium]|nr:glycosyltransferase family 2 protein [Vicingaceae bacterium]